MLSNPNPERLSPADHQQVLTLFQLNPHYHLHLDWHTLAQWLPHADLLCRVIRQDREVVALLGATVQRPPEGDGGASAWLRMMFAPRLAAHPLLDRLWEALQADLRACGVDQVAALATEGWVERVLPGWGFERINSVITLRRDNGSLPPRPNGNYRIYPAAQPELGLITYIDGLAFETLWHYDQETLEIAYSQASSVSIIEVDGWAAGYQLSTYHAQAGHLARLAVLPDAQGRGLGGHLMADLLHSFARRGITTVTVNTQADNIRSQNLYRRMGFKPIQHSVPVWALGL